MHTTAAAMHWWSARDRPGHRRLTVGSGTATIRVSRMHISTRARRRAITVYEPDPPALCASVAGSSAVLPLLTGLGLSSLDFKEALPELLGKDVDELSPTGNYSPDRYMIHVRVERS
jgi:hypothetical protein